MLGAGVVASVLAFQGLAARPVVVAQFVVNGAMFTAIITPKMAMSEYGNGPINIVPLTPSRGVGWPNNFRKMHHHEWLGEQC
jgi:hypothetical protein